MEGAPVNLNAARAAKQADGTLWAPLDCLKQIVADIEAGVISPKSCHVSLLVPGKDERIIHRWYQAGLTRAEQIAYLNVAIQELTEDWRS